jgi:4-amino-4-deoxy-L-arabinose transferase-like glycosyltransferase
MTSTDWPTVPPAVPPAADRSLARPPADPPPAATSPAAAARRPIADRVGRLVRGRPEDPRWARPALVALLVGTAVLYLWTLSESGWANSFYSAAVQAGSKSWKAFFFGSSDAANAITVDKPPLSLWPMALSVRLFGLSSFAILLPQALMGVGTVAVVHHAVRRWFGAASGLLAGAVLALTPVAALMFRFNNPDALLTLLMAVAAYTALRAIEGGRWTWFAATGVAVGLGFLTKQLQVLLVVPGFALAHLAFGGSTWWRRVRDLAIAGAAMVASAGWWIAIVELVPASARPYVGGSQTNSILELTFGYNGLGRLTGNETGSVGGGAGPGGTGMWGATGITRLFGSEIGGQITWLVPAALILLVATAALWWRAPRRDMRRTSLAVWGSWLLVTGLVFSFMGGIFHAYYTVALAPAVAALVGIGVVALWRHISRPAALVVLAATVGVTAWWARVLLARAPDWNPWLSTVVLGAGGAAVGGLLVAAWCGQFWDRVAASRIAMLAAPFAVVAALAGPTAWTLQTVSTGHTGSIVTAGPTVAGSGFGPGGGRGPGGGQGPGGVAGPGGPAGATGAAGTGGFGPPAAGQGAFMPPTGAANGTRPGGMGGGMGGLLGSTTPSKEVVAALRTDASDYTWVAAAVGSNNASGYQLATELPVMAIGGFNGSDPWPTLAAFQKLVAAGRIHWFIGGGGFGGAQMGGSDAGSEIASWVQEHFTATTVGDTTLYDLTQPTA